MLQSMLPFFIMHIIMYTIYKNTKVNGTYFTFKIEDKGLYTMFLIALYKSNLSVRKFMKEHDLKYSVVKSFPKSIPVLTVRSFRIYKI